jgi:putative addiction module component (TIGR02574 family)
VADTARMSPSAPEDDALVGADPRGYTDAMAIPDKLREEALRLPPADRAKLATILLESLDDGDRETMDAAAIEKAWDDEIRRRTEEIDAGTAEMISEEDFWKLLDG